MDYTRNNMGDRKVLNCNFIYGEYGEELLHYFYIVERGIFNEKNYYNNYGFELFNFGYLWYGKN
jgi:hypothetical protein